MDDQEKRLKANLKKAEERFGPDHLNTGYALVQLAEFYVDNGNAEQSEQCHTRIRRILELWLKEHAINFNERNQP